MRTPTLAFDSTYNEAALRQHIQDPAFAEALFLASPELHGESHKVQHTQPKSAAEAKKQDRLYRSLGRYYGRMSSRCTPFALFAGCSVVRWGAQSLLQRDSGSRRRHTRLDMHYLCALARHLANWSVLRERLRYFPNSSLYRIGDEFRYVESQADAEHQISSAAYSEPLAQILTFARAGAGRAALAGVVAEATVTVDEALAFVDELIEAQLLVSELEPTVTGAEFLSHLLGVLARLQAEQPCEELAGVLGVLRQVEQALLALDRPDSFNLRDAYAQIGQLLAPLGAPVEASKLFQTDLIFRLPEATLAQAWQAPLLEAVEVLTYLATPSHNERLERFKQSFYARYEEQEVPLLEALDAESGIGYANYGSNTYLSLVHNLTLSGQAATKRSISQDDVQHFLYQKLRAADRHGDYNIELSLEELRHFQPVAGVLPPSVSVLFRVLDEQQLVLDSVGGSSATSLLGRFAHAEPDIEELVRALAEQEQERNPGVQFAEISHLPASRIGNILLRPNFRRYEIPFLAQSSLPTEQQLPPQDLFLAVRQGQLVLRSRRLNQLVMPRLSSAHNYTTNALPVYQFLCDLQTQGLQGQLNFRWESISFYTKFLPRLTCGKVILQPASWQLPAEDFQCLLAPQDWETAFAAFRARWRLPARFTLADGDNELLVDAANPFTVRIWLDAIRSRSTIRLKEFLFDAARSPVRDAAGRGYVSQFVASLLRREATYAAFPALPPKQPASAGVQREFTLGSEWLYTKIYCGPRVADRVLVAAVKPLTDALRTEGLIDQWFFVRYADPDPHLRVRLHLPDVARVGQVVQRLSEVLTPLVSEGYIWKTQTDTYRRELERYGAATIEQAEALFCADSEHAVQLLGQTLDRPEASDVYWLGGLHFLDELLTAFAYSTTAKSQLLRRLKDAFAHEFNDKSLKRQLDKKYREHRAAIEQVLQPGADLGLPVPLPAYHQGAVVRRVARQLLQLHAQQQLQPGLDQLLSSYIHMLLNRLIAEQPRLHELVIYDFLYRHYQSQLARVPTSCSP
ncbi:MAG: lantibiotic dehydratase [Bacteroidota bacterium]|nr:lantibiotic dehydratase [Bacteroidota bacterium]